MADLSYTVDVNTTAGVTNLQKLQDKVTALSGKFTTLQTSVTALFLGATVKGAMAFADAISDIATATNIATENVLGFSHAVEMNGGSSEGAQKALTKLGIAIGDAADGSDKAQNAFARVGVTLTDLRNLSEKQILAKTIKGLADIKDASIRASAQAAIFGKTLKGVDMVGIAAGYNDAVIESVKYARAVDQAGVVHDKLSAAFEKFQLSLLKTLGPLADFLEKLKPEQIDAFIEALVKIGGTAGAIAGVSKAIGWVIAGITALSGYWAAGSGLVVTGAAKMSGAFVALAEYSRYIGVAIADAWTLIKGPFAGMADYLLRIRLAFAAVGSEAGTFWTILRTVLGVGAVGVGAFATGVGAVALAIAGVAAVAYTLGEVIDMVFGTRIISGFADGVTYIWNKMKDIAGLKAPSAQDTSDAARQAFRKSEIADYAKINKALAEEATKTRDVKNALDAKILSIQQASKEYAFHNAQVLKGIGFENSMIGKTAEETEVWRAQKSVFDDAGAAMKKLTDEKLAAQAALKPGETSMSSYYDAEIKKIRESAEADAARLGVAVTGNQSLKAIEKDRLQTIENITKAIEDQIARQQTLGGLLQGANDKRVDVAFEGAQAKRNPLEKQMASIQEEARKASLEAGRAFSAGFEGMDLSTAQAQELADGLAVIADRYNGIRDAQLANLDASRSWEAGWKDAFDSYVENATNAATRAGETFNAISGAMNSAIDNFVDNGKFSFADFASSLIKDMIKIEMKALAMEGLKGLFGEKGSGGGLFSAIGSFFGGFFADGGQPPMNKPSMVGEKGPELFIPRSAGTIVPNGGAAGGGQQITNNNTTVNHYTVNAVDAKSVAQLFAENRKQLLGTVRMAQAEQPFASRI